MKKTIYAFTFEDDEYPSNDFINNIKVVASLMYDELRNLDCENPNPILVHNNIIHNNQLYESYIGSNYRYIFESEKCKVDYTLYEPLLFDGNSFGITVYDDNITVNELAIVLDKVLKLLNLNYHVSIFGLSYISKNENDESKRKITIRRILTHMRETINDNKSSTKIKKLISPVLMPKAIRG